MIFGEPAGRGTRALSVLGAVVIAGVLVGLIDYWVGRLTHASTVIADLPRDSSPRELAAMLQDKHLFGIAAANPAASAGIVPTTDIALVGLVSGGLADAGIAILTVNGKRTTVRAGSEIAPGLVLSRVRGDSVEIVQNGTAFTLGLRSKK